jgi:hypothetical protein
MTGAAAIAPNAALAQPFGGPPPGPGLGGPPPGPGLGGPPPHPGLGGPPPHPGLGGPPEKCSETSRGKGNHLFSNGIWFDVDGGDLAPAAFANLFPTLRMTIFSTFSSTKKMPRYRV